MTEPSIYRRRATPAILAVAALAMATVGATCESRTEPPLTVVLVEYRGPEAAASGQRLAKELTDKGLAGVFVVEGPDVTSVCVGRFADRKDAEAEKTLQRVRAIRDQAGQYPFVGVMLMPVPEAAPKNAWPVEKAPGTFTLHVASWESPGRAAAAQAYAAELRSRGEEAYVYHGPRLSMVTVGSFGPEVFDDATRLGRPGVKPEIVDPKALALIRKFPRMRLEGQETPVPTGLVKIPGREPPAAGPAARVIFRIALQLVATETGRVPAKGEASGIAEARQDVPPLVQVLAQQIRAAIPQGAAARVGVAGILATDPDAVKEKADRLVSDALTAGLAQGAPALTVSDPETTAQVLDAGGLKTIDVLRDPERVKGLKGLDYVVVGTVTILPAR